MRLPSKLTLFITLLAFTGCVPGTSTTSLNHQSSQPLLFKTNQVHFMYDLKENSTLKERNKFIDEFILKSDMQCQNHLNNPLKKPETDEAKTSLYMNLFDSVATLFGISLVTNSAKAVFLENNIESEEEKKAFANALSPEIRKGIELGRTRYAKTMKENKKLDLKTYSIQDVKVDTFKYDKQCHDDYGLIEINSALKEMQNAVHSTPTVKTPSVINIDPTTIKDKVVAATKEVEEKKEEKKLQENNATQKDSTTKAVPKQLKPVSAPSHHDSVPQMPRSIQL